MKTTSSADVAEIVYVTNIGIEYLGLEMHILQHYTDKKQITFVDSSEASPS